MSRTPISDELRLIVERAIEQGASQSSIARDSGVARSKVCDWINGKATITLETADRIASICLDSASG